MNHQAVLVIMPHPLPQLHTLEGKMLAAMVGDRDLRRLIELEIERLLRPYRHDLPVAPYLEPCPCVGAAAMLDVRPLIDAMHGSADDLDRDFRSRDPFPIPEGGLDAGFRGGVDAAYRARVDDWRDRYSEWMAPRRETEARLLGKHPLHNKPDPLCLECDGTGKRKTTRNPFGHFDGYVIGGRWAGFLSSARPRRRATAPAVATVTVALYAGAELLAQGSTGDLDTGTICPVPQVRRNLAVDAVVAPDGEWCDIVKPGRFDPAAEQAETARLLKLYPDDLAVIVDCYLKADAKCHTYRIVGA